MAERGNKKAKTGRSEKGKKPSGSVRFSTPSRPAMEPFTPPPGEVNGPPATPSQPLTLSIFGGPPA